MYGMLILKDEHAIDVLNSGNIRHLWHDFHAIDVHATDVGDPNDGGLRTWLAALHPPPTWNSGHVQLPSKHSKYSSLRRRAGKRI